VRVVATKVFQLNDIDYLINRLPDVDFWFPRNDSELDDLAEVVHGVDVFLGPPPSPEIIAAVIDTLKLVQIPWSGVDGVDFSACQAYSVTVANSHTNATSVAELAISLCLDALKLISFHDSEFRKGFWHRPGSHEGFYPPRMMTGLSVGYIGFGAIGREIYRLLDGFKLDSAALTYSGGHHAGMRFYDRHTQFTEFLKRSDILFLAAPLTSETQNIIDDKALSHMRETCVLVNVSRAELINVNALHEALSKRKISGAALDVHWRHLSAVEQKLAKEIASMQNVVVSPHRGGFAAGGLPHLDGAVVNLLKVAEGRFDEILGKIDFSKGY
jgi:phosphoglycerate dehydrogenase-like enzyme